MTFKEYFENKAIEEFDEQLYNTTKTKDTKAFKILFIIMFSISGVILLTGIILSIFKKGDAFLMLAAISVGFLVLGFVFMLLAQARKEDSSDENNKKQYIYKYIAKTSDLYHIQGKLLDAEYDEELLNYTKNSLRYVHNDFFCFTNAEDKSFLIVECSAEANKNSFKFADVSGYSMFQNGELICSAKAGDTNSIRNFSEDESHSFDLVLELLKDNQIYKYNILNKEEKNHTYYKKASAYFTMLFNHIDEELLG